MRRLVRVWLAALWVAAATAAAPHDDETMHMLLHDLDSQPSGQGRAHRKEVKRHLGMADTSTVFGYLFNYSIPEDAFAGSIDHFEVTEAGKQTLPDWLQYDSKSHAFQGVPFGSDIGQYYICVKAIGSVLLANGQSSVAKDVFSIEVVEDSAEGVPHEFHDSLCPTAEGPTLASVILDTEPTELHPMERIRLLESLASLLQMSLSKFHLTALKSKETIFDPSALLAGPGNTRKQHKKGVTVQFQVGCSGAISPQFESILSLIEKKAKDGDLADAAGYPVVGWQVTGLTTQIPKRDKRNVPPQYRTPVPGVRITRWPQITERIDEVEPSEESAPESRIIPTMASPFFHQPSAHHHPHRHRHGQAPLHRENYIQSADLMSSPTLAFRTLPTNRIHGTPMPTPALFPERPTAYVIKPSRVVFENIRPTDQLRGSMSPPLGSEDLMSRWYVATTDLVTVDLKPTRSRIIVEPTKQLPQVPNFQPTVNNRLKKLSLVVGKAWSYQIPRDTFVDLEDGNTRDLKLIFMTSQRTSIQSSSWIQFDPERQILYALPLDDNVGKHEYVLEAMDSEGSSTFDRVELHVWQHPSVKSLNHAFMMTVRYIKWQYPVGIDWQIDVLNRLAQLFGDKDSSLLTVLLVTLDPVKITWANDTLLALPCTSEAITEMFNVLATDDGQPTKEMKKLMHPFRIQDIRIQYRGPCKGVVTSSAPTPNFSPKVRNPIHHINVTVGDVLKFKIPEETFYDFEDGSSKYLRLTLLEHDGMQPPKSSWIQFDSSNQEIYGIATASHIGSHQYQISAMDSDGFSVANTFTVHVHRLPITKKPPVEFSIHLDHDFEEFIIDTNKKTLMAGKIARLYGDLSPKYIMVTSITKGSVVYAWSNKTLPNDYCPKDRIDELVKLLVNEDGTLTASLLQVMEPEFKVSKADAIPVGICLGGVPPTFVTLTTTTPPPPPPTEVEPTSQISTDDDIYITTIVPAVVIAVMLIVAAVVAYFLYRKKRKGKLSLGDKDFIGSGVPVVFAGELEEHKPDPAKAPAIMKNEKPPLSSDHLPNPFRRGTAAVRDSTPQTTPKARDRTRERKEPSQLYQPPPPFTSSRESKTTRPKSTSTYRHPTYVPP